MSVVCVTPPERGTRSTLILILPIASIDGILGIARVLEGHKSKGRAIASNLEGNINDTTVLAASVESEGHEPPEFQGCGHSYAWTQWQPEGCSPSHATKEQVAHLLEEVVKLPLTDVVREVSHIDAAAVVPVSRHGGCTASRFFFLESNPLQTAGGLRTRRAFAWPRLCPMRLAASRAPPRRGVVVGDRAQLTLN